MGVHKRILREIPMKFEIKNRFSGSVIFSIETESWKLAVEAAVKSSADLSSADLRSANLSSADLRSANLCSADLRSANLRSANLRSANLSSADLCSADLSSADLRSANLSSADLRSANLCFADLCSAVGIDKNRSTPLRILLEQPGPVRAYKLVNATGEGPFNGGINYLKPEVEEFSVKNFTAGENEQCGAGINLATLDWVMREWKPGYRILIMEFFVSVPPGNLVIPTCTDGKFRVKTCRRVGEKNLKELGLVKE